jgi:hypothetical protein
MHEDLNNHIGFTTPRAVMVHCLIDLKDCFDKQVLLRHQP